MGGPDIKMPPAPPPLPPPPDPEPDFQETPTNILSKRKKRRGRWSLRSRPGIGGTGINIPD